MKTRIHIHKKDYHTLQGQTFHQWKEAHKDKDSHVLVFVYGTLRKGHGNHRLLTHEEFLGKGLTKEKYALYQSGIPFLFMQEEICHITGELYKVSQETLARLDRLEGHPRCYERKLLPVLVNQNELQAWIYTHPRPYGALNPTGDYENTIAGASV